MNGTDTNKSISQVMAEHEGVEPKRKRRPALKTTATDLPTAQKRFAKLVKQRSKLQAKLAKVGEALDEAEKIVISLTKQAAK